MSYIRISQEDYLKYKQNWSKAISTNFSERDFFVSADHFMQGNDYIYGYKIAETLRGNMRASNASNPLLTRMVFRYVIDDSAKVRIVLFGIDQISNDPLTPYYLLNEPITTKPVINLSFNKIKIDPKKAEEWTMAWHHEISKRQNLDATLFHVVNAQTQGEASKLQNYTFDFKEVNKMASLGVNKDVNLYFAINKHPKPLEPNVAGRNLFSLVVEWDFHSVNEENSYYDVSNPCPVCCPGCP
jgi:hypothetical protein